MVARLYTLSLSHPGMASRLALEHKEVEHEVVELLPGLHPIVVRGLGFGAATVPALRIDGIRVQGSLAITQYLESTRPDPPLYPSEPLEHAAVAEAERWGESVLQPIPRRIFRFVATHSQAVRRWMVTEVVGMPLPGITAAANKPVAAVMGRIAGADEPRIRADLAALPGLLDQVESLIEQGTIGGQRPNAADLQIFSSIRSLASFADLAPIMADRPATLAAARLVPPFPGPVPATLPRGWFDQAQAVDRFAR